MENEIKPTPEAMAYAQERLQLAAIRALIESHPDAASFRESWAHMLGMMYRDHMHEFAGQQTALEDTGQAFRLLQPVWETYFPGSEAANSKPKPG